jgi:hypothetical protein
MSKEDPDGLKRLYCAIMTEIKVREKVIYQLLTGELKIGSRPAFELCHLEMRMICELIAIACLAAHGDIPTTRSGRMREAYAADFILSALGKMHKDFFPIPMRVEKRGTAVTLRDQTEPALTKKDLLTLYHKCGDVLHRGCIKEMGPHQIPEEEFLAMRDWPLKIGNLINNHTIILSGKPTSLIWVRVDSSLVAHMSLLSDLQPEDS